MARNQRLVTDQDFQEAIERQARVRVFRDDAIIDSGGTIVRFDESIVVTQRSVSEVSYHRRDECEFFEMPS